MSYNKTNNTDKEDVLGTSSFLKRAVIPYGNYDSSNR